MKKEMKLLKFGLGNNNNKLKKIDDWQQSPFKTLSLTFTLPSGTTCPSAKICKTFYSQKLHKIVDNGEIRCFSAMSETRPSVGSLVWHNYNLLRPIKKDVKALTNLIYNSLVNNKYGKPELVRVHVGGDFFTPQYMLAWFNVASKLKDITFYSYTKEIKTLKDNIGFKPDNYIFTLSYGGKHDNLIKDLNIKSATIVDSENDTELPIDTNEFLALTSNKDFALVKHGTQPKK